MPPTSISTSILNHHFIKTIFVSSLFSKAGEISEDGELQIAPNFSKEPKTQIFFLNSSGAMIDCEVDGRPQPRVTWVVNRDTKTPVSAFKLNFNGRLAQKTGWKLIWGIQFGLLVLAHVCFVRALKSVALTLTLVILKLQV